MKPGDSVFRDSRGNGDRGHAHAIAKTDRYRITTACGIRFRRAELSYNLGRRKPCSRCAAAIERRSDKT